jgi:hypothetical protein
MDHSMSQVENAIHGFVSAVEATPARWESLDIRMCGLRARDNVYNMLSVWRLDVRRPDEIPLLQYLPVTDRLVCVQAVVPFAELTSLLRAASLGKLTVNDHNFVLRSLAMTANGEELPYDRADVLVASRLDPYGADTGVRAAHRLNLYGNTVGPLLALANTSIDQLDDHLRALPCPWDGIAAIQKNVLRTRSRSDYHTSVSLEVVAPIDARLALESSSFERGRLQVGVNVGPSLSRAAVTIGYFGLTPERSVVSGTLVDATPDANGGRVSSVVVDEAEAITVFLRAGSLIVDRVELRDSSFAHRNVRLDTYRPFDPEFATWLKYLRPDQGSDSVQFEWAVARLFHACGLTVDGFVGVNQVKEAPDALAFAPPTPNVYVIECTTGTLNANGKLSKLVERVDRVRRALLPYGYVKVHGVIVTSLDRVPDAELGAAAQDTVVVIQRADTEAMLAMAREAAPLAEVVALLATLASRQSKAFASTMPFGVTM